MNKWLWIIIPLIVISGLVGWRLKLKSEANAELVQQQGARQGMAPPVEITTAGSKEILSHLESVGTAESPYRVEISPKISGRIDYLVVREGDEVSKGQLLIKIDPSELQAQVLQQQASVAEARSRLAQAQLNQAPTEVSVRSQIQQQRASLRSAQAELNQVRRNFDSHVAAAEAGVSEMEARVRAAESQVVNARAQIEREQASLNNVKARFTRVENLYRQGFIAAQEVDDARTAVEVQTKVLEVAKSQLNAALASEKSAQAQLEAARSQAAIVRRKGEADIESARAHAAQAEAALKVAHADLARNPAYRQNLAALQANLQVAEAQLRQAQARMAETEIRAPIKGTITARNADPGTLATPGQPIIVLQHLDWLYVATALPQEQNRRVFVGQQAEVRFDALSNKTFKGKITHINPAADLQSRQFSLLIRLENPQRELKPGMYGKVFILTERVEAKVTVPREAVRTNRDGTPIVMVIDEENVAHERRVKTGVSDATSIQILEGIQSGDKVITLSNRPVRDGQKVQPASEPQGERRRQ